MTIEKLSSYGHEFQIKVLSALLTDATFLNNVADVLDVEYFESPAHKWIVGYILEYYNKHHTYPTMNVLAIETKKEKNEVLRIAIKEELKQSYTTTAEDSSYVKEEFRMFCLNQRLKGALLSSVDLLHAGAYDDIRRIIDDALKAGEEKNIGHVYKEDIETRFRDTGRIPIPTPWPQINKLTEGGPSGGDLFLLFGNPGGGKSWCLVDIGGFAVKCGFTVFHYTLELTQAYTARRYDAYFTDISVTDISKHRKEVEIACSQLTGELIVHGFSSGRASLSHIQSHIRQCRNQGINPDLILIDYLDLLKSRKSRKDRKEEIDDVYLSARGLAQDEKVPIWSPSQVNRMGAKDNIIEGDKAAGSYDKIMLSDFCMSLSRKKEDKLNGTGRFHVMKNRYGPDGMTYNAKIDTSKGYVIMQEEYTEDSSDMQQSNKSNTLIDDSELVRMRSKFLKIGSGSS